MRKNIVKLLLLSFLLLSFWFSYFNCRCTDHIRDRFYENSMRIVVLPFKNSTGNTKYDWISEFLIEKLSVSLAQVKQLTVLDKSKMKDILDKYQINEKNSYNINATEELKKFKIDKVVFGNYFINDDDIDVTVKFVDVATSEILNDHTFSGNDKLKNVLPLINKISLKVSDKFGITPSDIEKERMQQTVNVTVNVTVTNNNSNTITPINTEALEYYTLGKKAYDLFTKKGNEDAIFYFNKAISLYKNYKEAISALARVYERIGQYDKAIEYDVLVYNIAKTENNNYWIAQSYKNLGGVNYKKRAYNVSSNYIDSAIVMFKELKDIIGIAQSYNWKGFVYLANENYEEASKYHNLALNLFDSISNIEGQAESYNYIGTIYYYQKDFDNALTYFSKSAVLNEEVNDKQDLADAYVNIGVIYLADKKDYNVALDYFNKVLKLLIDGQDNMGIATNYNNIGSCYLELRDKEKAIEYFNLGLEYAKKIEDKLLMGIINERIGNTYERKNDYNLAKEYYKKALDFFKRIDAKSRIERVKDAIKRLERY